MGRKNRPVKIRKKSLPDVTRIQPPKRMDIWYAHLRENTGTSVQEGSRPVLVISNDMANKNSDVVTVIPLTSQMKRIELPTHCIIHDLLDEDLDIPFLVENGKALDENPSPTKPLCGEELSAAESSSASPIKRDSGAL